MDIAHNQSATKGFGVMKDNLKIRHIAGAAALALVAIASGFSAHAADVKVGVLNCNVASGWGFVVGSSKDVRCEFSPVGSGPIERYAGTVSKFGVDIGYTRGGVIIWDVVAPAADANRGALQGSYAGATVSATIGVGAGTNALVGGLHKSVALQPISITGESGLNVVAGIGALHLKYVR
jgi:hypothetical protein